MNDTADRDDAAHDLMERITQFHALIEQVETTDCEKLRSAVLSRLNQVLQELNSATDKSVLRDIAFADRAADAYNLLFVILNETDEFS